MLWIVVCGICIVCDCVHLQCVVIFNWTVSLDIFFGYLWRLIPFHTFLDEIPDEWSGTIRQGPCRNWLDTRLCPWMSGFIGKKLSMFYFCPGTSRRKWSMLTPIKMSGWPSSQKAWRMLVPACSILGATRMIGHCLSYSGSTSRLWWCHSIFRYWSVNWHLIRECLKGTIRRKAVVCCS